MRERTSPTIHEAELQIGAVLVVGGGIAGMQASLDLADQGFKVYLVESDTAIGGHMAQLDKTFPTNDCAMCNISPKLVDTGRHPDIEILTGSEVLSIHGEVGNFTARVLRKPRYVDVNKCIGCGECVPVCPVSIFDPYEEGLKTRKAIYRRYSQAVPAAYAIEKLGTAPCRSGCPVGQRAQGYIALIAQGRYREALRVIKEENPFPSVCGRTCHHPCEGKCTRALVDEAVSIMSLKRFVVDYALAYGREKAQPVARTHPEWVAVVGSGPAGLTAAHDLVKMGYGVTVYEALGVPGGMMRVGIPAHRLPKGELQQDIDDILALGVVLKTNSPVEDPVKLLEQGYNAVCMATGISSASLTLGIEGEQAEGVMLAPEFLRKINLGQPVQIGDHVAVVGGGITALDTAAVARRLGAEVYLVLDRPRGELPAYQTEIEAVEAEGIHIFEHMTAARILSENGRVAGVELARADQGYITDATGRRRPKLVPGSEMELEVDTVIGTVEQVSDLAFLALKYQDLPADKNTLASSIPGLFVVGGRKTGASYVIEAVALGHKVARSIDRYLQGLPLLDAEAPAPPVIKLTRQEVAEQVKAGHIQLVPRQKPALLSMGERTTSFREVVLGLTEHQARAEAERCLQCGVCSECMECSYACGVDAIDHNSVAREEEIRIGAVILAPGYQAYSAQHSAEYGLVRYPNVLTALQFERLLSASGPTLGHVLRPSDQRGPKRIAFLQCVGSRDQAHDYCSSVCCMYATKEAVIAKEHSPDLDVHIYMMDMRAFSKGYLGYFEQAKQRYGVNYHHSRISQIQEDPQTHDLLLRFSPAESYSTNRVSPETAQAERFDMVVLSVGMEISEQVRELGRQLGVELDEYGFCQTVQFDPLETNRPGIYAVGPFREPKDIPESVVEASGAAAAVAGRLYPTRFSLSQRREKPVERDTSGEEPRIGVFVCSCGSNIGGFLDVPEVAGYAKSLPHVCHSEWNLYTCSQDSIERITEQVQQHRLNRVVVASCSPLTHKPLFQESIQAAGLNPYLFEMANIRNQCSWVHSLDREVAGQKAKDLVRMAVARAALLEPQKMVDVQVKQAALVVGGGAAGMVAALSLADQGFPVHLVEKQAELGGNLRNLYKQVGGKDPQELLCRLLQQVHSNSNISLHLESQVIASSGFMGNFSSTILGPAGKQQVTHGATILATGAREDRDGVRSLRKDERILTQQKFEAWLFDWQQTGEAGKSKRPSRVVVHLCAGQEMDYCSRVCCYQALKNILWLKELSPETEVLVLYKDIRAYGFKEKLYKECRAQKVLFVRYHRSRPPQVEHLLRGNELQPTLVVRAWESTLGKWIEWEPDLYVRALPVVPAPETKTTASIFKVPQDANGFFMEAHVKLRPVDFASDGIFMAGMAHFPKLLDEAIIQAKAAAARSARVLSREIRSVGGRVAVVDPELCTGCLTCLRICPFGVPQIDTSMAGAGGIYGAASIEAAVCQGCGTCASECPARAIQLKHYTDTQMSALVTALVGEAV
jgi:heterodisulfide reductase subunit A-like polyferredoxin